MRVAAYRPLLPFTFVCNHSLLLLPCSITTCCTSTNLADKKAINAALAIQPKTYVNIYQVSHPSPRTQSLPR